MHLLSGQEALPALVPLPDLLEGLRVLASRGQPLLQRGEPLAEDVLSQELGGESGVQVGAPGEEVEHGLDALVRGVDLQALQSRLESGHH